MFKTIFLGIIYLAVAYIIYKVLKAFFILIKAIFFTKKQNKLNNNFNSKNIANSYIAHNFMDEHLEEELELHNHYMSDAMGNDLNNPIHNFDYED